MYIIVIHDMYVNLSMYIIVIHDMYVNLSDSGTCLNQTMNNPESCHEV